MHSFYDVVGATENEAILFGWVIFASREARDPVNEKVANDPGMEELMAAADVGFDAERMAYGGFRSRRFCQSLCVYFLSG